MANGGWETFLAYEDPDQDILVGLLRLRKCASATYRPELKPGPNADFKQCSIVRELHVYGSVVPVSFTYTIYVTYSQLSKFVALYFCYIDTHTRICIF